MDHTGMQTIILAVVTGIVCYALSRRLRLPMVPGNRSLNLSNAAAVIVFEAWRQLGFAGADSAAR